MPIKLANNASGTLATAISASDTGIVLTTGNGAEFPTLGAGDYFYATLVSSGGTQEIVKATARSGDSLTVVRAQENTSATGFAAGSRFELRVTVAAVREAINDVASAAAIGFTPYANIAATNVQAAIQEEIDDLAASGGAALVGNTPAGGIAATTVQGALNELDTEKISFTRLDDSDGSSLVGFLQAGTGAVTRTAQSKMRDVVSVKDFGAVGDGVTDDTVAIVNSLAASARVYLPAGTYKVTATIDVPAGSSLIGESSDGSKLTKFLFAPSIAGSSLFRHQGADGISYADFAVEGPGYATGTLESAFDMFTTVAAERQVTFDKVNISKFNRAGIYLGGQWQVTVCNCTFVECGNRSSIAAFTGGIVFREDGALPAWSGSGNVIQDNYFTGCSYGIYGQSAWSVILLNNIYEYNSYPFYRDANGALWTEIGGWMENNTNPEVIRGPMFRVGGRGTSMADHSVSFGTEGSVVIGNSGISFYRTSVANATILPNGQIASPNGKVYVGTAGAAPFDACSFGGNVSSGDFARIRNLQASGATSAIMFRFLSDVDATVGSISSTGSATAYTTTSDYRLKTDVSPITGAIDKIRRLRPVTYKWKIDGSAGEGFIAHELSDVFPQAVVGQKDATEFVKLRDVDGNVISQEERPVYQTVDTSFLIGSLVAAIQEQQKMIEELHQKLTLKGF